MSLSLLAYLGLLRSHHWEGNMLNLLVSTSAKYVIFFISTILRISSYILDSDFGIINTGIIFIICSSFYRDNDHHFVIICSFVELENHQEENGGPYKASIPLRQATNPEADVLLAYEMNGEVMS